MKASKNLIHLFITIHCRLPRFSHSGFMLSFAGLSSLPKPQFGGFHAPVRFCLHSVCLLSGAVDSQELRSFCSLARQQYSSGTGCDIVNLLSINQTCLEYPLPVLTRGGSEGSLILGPVAITSHKY